MVSIYCKTQSTIISKASTKTVSLHTASAIYTTTDETKTKLVKFVSYTAQRHKLPLL